MASYAASRTGAAMDIRVLDGESVVRASVPIRHSPFGGYVNLTASFEDAPGIPHPTRVWLGHLPVPDFLAAWLLRQAVRRLYAPDSEQLAAEMIRSVSMHDGRVHVEYQWRDDAPDRMRAMAVSAEDATRFRAYHDRVVEVMGTLPQSRQSFSDLLGPLMQLAAERSARGAHPVVENRAAIMVATFYVNGIEMDAVVPGAETWPSPRRRMLLLQGRADLTQHFTVSAVLAATAGTPLSHVISVYKEIADSRGGSGFSFSELAADRAGTTFDALAVTSAEALQRGVRCGPSEGDEMPAITGLVDGLAEPEFVRRFGSVDSPEYDRVVREIDRRVAQCRLFREMTGVPGRTET